jgi:hypothetical protein
MRKSIKRLSLHRETIGDLTTGDLAGAAGMSTAPGCSKTCPSRISCGFTNCATGCDCVQAYTC